MGRPRNYKIGEKGEARITKLILEELPDAIVEKGPYGGHPDLLMKFNGQHYALECKTSHLLKRNQLGWVKLPASQIEAMQMLPTTGAVPLLVAEFRQGGAKSLYIMVPWHCIVEKYRKNKPSVMSLMFRWIIHNGFELRRWLRGLRRAES